jgi:hypothetical protein
MVGKTLVKDTSRLVDARAGALPHLPFERRAFQRSPPPAGRLCCRQQQASRRRHSGLHDGAGVAPVASRSCKGSHCGSWESNPVNATLRVRSLRRAITLGGKSSCHVCGRRTESWPRCMLAAQRRSSVDARSAACIARASYAMNGLCSHHVFQDPCQTTTELSARLSGPLVKTNDM